MTGRSASRKAAASTSSRQRWQPEEDALVQEYVGRHGPREWHLLRSRMGVSASRFPRDPKSCAERWKNYLRPGLRKGPLSSEEQALALTLQARHGNRWKLIARSLPGRTPKRLGKWWEVYSDRQRKQKQRQQPKDKLGGEQAQQDQKGRYDHILDTYVEKHVLPAACENSVVGLEDGTALMKSGTRTHGAAESAAAASGTPGPVLSLGGALGSSSGAAVPSTSTSTAYHQHLRHAGGGYMNNYYDTNYIPPAASVHPQLPPWLSTAAAAAGTGTGTGGALVLPTASSITAATPSSPQSVGLSLTSTPSGGNNGQAPTASSHHPQLAALGSLWRDLEDSRQGLVQHRKEAAWRLGRLEQQLETEKARRAEDKVAECEARVRALREEQAAAMERIEAEYRDQLAAIQRDAESREGRLIEGWAARHARLARVVERIGSGAASPTSGAGVQQFTLQFPYNGK